MTTYVLVHGAFVDGWYWGETAALLEREGHRVLVADLPSTGTDPAVLGSLADDAAEVRALIDDAGEPVVLVGHSYGGMVVTELAGHPAIARTVYVGAMWPARGQTILDVFGELPSDGSMVPTEDGAAFHVSPDAEVARNRFAADLDTARFADYHARMMFSSAANLGAASTAPQRSHPVTYVVLEKDLIFDPARQEAAAAYADRVERLTTSHAPMLSDPDGLTAILVRAAGAGR